MTQRKILITGTSRGLGLAIAEHLLDKGDLVFGCSRSESQLIHQNYHHFPLDVTNEQAVDDFFYDLRKKYKVIDGLINNAGIARMNAFALTPVRSVKDIFEINVTAAFHFCQKSVGLLRKAEHARIINMSTVAVPMLLEGEAAYAASKSAVETLTKIMAKELGVFGITCNAIGPSPIQTDLIKGVSRDKIDQLVKQQSIKRMANADDINNVVEFFLDPASDMITGQIIYLGGLS